MKSDGEVRLFLEARRKGASQQVAAARSGMCERTARKYERSSILPSQAKIPRTHRTRKNPFADDWSWICEHLQRDGALQANTLFELLCELRPGIYQQNQIRTLQRHMRNWRAQSGPEREIMFPQIHQPGQMMQSDFTCMKKLKVTIAGADFPHLLFHLILTFSNTEAVRICFSESFEALLEGFEACVWRIGGVAREHRTDNLSSAILKPDRSENDRLTKNYKAMLAHYSMQYSTNTAGCANENGDVEQSHHRLKTAIDQALRIRGDRNFKDRRAYDQFIQKIVQKRNQKRDVRFALEIPLLQALPTTRLEHMREIHARVSRFSIINVLNNRYSVPSRLIGSTVKIHVRSEELHVYHMGSLVLTLPRMRGINQQRIDYRHVAWSLARKPGAFSGYCYREELFPTTTFRRAYDALKSGAPTSADREYVRILHRAASTSETEVDSALQLLLEREILPIFDEVKSLTECLGAIKIPELKKPDVNLHEYDLLLSECCVA
jgi:hypothetical protein